MTARERPTPGPWERVGSVIRTTRKEDGMGGWLTADAVDSPYEERHANAQLLAAAPDLLDALRLALPYVELHSSAEALRDSGQVLAALARAEGQS